MLRCLLQTLDRTNPYFFSGPPLAALKTLSFSKNFDLQRSAALAFAEFIEEVDGSDEHETLDPILHLLDSDDTGVQEAARATLKHLVFNGGYFSVPV